jgi:hypothetical protein
VRRYVRKVQEVAAVVGAGVTVYNTARHYLDRYEEWRDERYTASLWSFTISEGDDETLFSNVMRWIMSQVAETPRKTISVGIHKQNLVEVVPDDDIRFEIEFEGVSIPVIVQQPKMPEGAPVAFNVHNGRLNDGRSIVFVCPSLTVRTRVIKYIEDKHVPSYIEASLSAHIYRSRKGGGWSHLRRLETRSQDTLFLPDGMLEDVIGDVQRFKDSKQAYVDRGIPWHRGYLLTGPPGTGKSSTICAVASEFKMNVNFLSLGEMESDSALIECMQEAEGIVVLEDVDVFSSSHSRTENALDTKGVSLNGLLNVLDGVLAPDGLITFMTTNYPEHLDTALMRPGRADRTFNLGYLNQEQLGRMVTRYVGEGFEPVALMRSDVAPAEIVECLKSSFDRPPEYILDCIREVCHG